ncbi:hypothetical protein [Streptomyces sp. NPDC004065]|uniref:hypothetical protein n=1 Tax=Streptomyces sp. NPDC004065 TaxID=3364689 RepID=UPI003850BF4E
MKSGSHNHNEIVVERPTDAAPATTAEPKPRDIEAVAASEQGPSAATTIRSAC